MNWRPVQLVALLVALAAGLLLLRPWKGAPGEPLDRDALGGDGTPLRADGSGGDPASSPVLRGDVPPPTPDTPLGAEECAVHGRVVHGDTGAGLAGVRLHAVPGPSDSHTRIVASTTTGEDGRFEMRGLGARVWRVDLVAMGGAWVNAALARGLAPLSASRGWEIELRPGESVSATLAVLPAAHLEGTVHDAAGAPVAGAQVFVPYGEGPGTPFWPQPAFHWHLVPPARTDADGRFVLRGLAYGDDVFVCATRADGVAADSAKVALRPPDTASVAIVLPGVRSARVRVVDAVTRAPIGGASVLLRRAEGRHDMRRGREGATDAGGVVVLGPVTAERSRLRVEALGYTAWHSWKAHSSPGDAWDLFAPGADDVQEVTIALEPASTLAGRIVVPEGHPAGLLQVAVSEVGTVRWTRLRYGPCDDDGRFAITVPPDKRWAFELLDPTRTLELADPPEVASGAQDLVLATRALVPPAAAWEGPAWEVRVVAPGGATLKGGSVSFLHQGSDEYLPTVLGTEPFDDDGPSGLELVGPAGDGSLSARIPVSPECGPVWIEVDAATEAGALPEVVRGPLGPEGGSLTVALPADVQVAGRVLDATGAPVQGAELEISARRPEGLPADWFFYGVRDRVLSDGDGRFVLRGVHSGSYDLGVVCAQGWVLPPPVEVRGGAHDVVVRLLAGVDAEVCVRDEAGAPVEGAGVGVRQVDGVRGSDADYWEDGRNPVPTDPQGIAVLEALESGGTFRLYITPPRERQKELARVKLEAWTPQDQEITLPAYLHVAGVVRSPTGEPVEGARVLLYEEERGDVSRTWTDADGRFAFQEVRPGPVRLGAYVPSLEPDYVKPLLRHTTAAGDRDVALVLDPRRVVRLDVQGERDEALELLVTPLDASTNARRHHVWLGSDASEVTVQGLSPGLRYRAWLGPTEDGRFAEALLEAQDDRALLAFRQGGTVTGTIRWDEKIDRAYVGIDHEGVVFGEWISDQPETFTLEGVPEGSWPVALWWALDGELHRREVQASAGDAIHLDLGEER